MTIDGFGFDKEPRADSLVPGSLIGYRQYSWDGLNFNSANSQFTMKLVAEENVAVCKRLSPRLNDEEHTAPGRTCHCGFYGWYDPYNIENTGVANTISNTSVLAAIEVWGRVILGTKGFRAEKMRVKGVIPPQWLVASRNQQDYFAWIEQVENLGAEVFPTLMDMMMKYPKPDVKDLLPEGMKAEEPPKEVGETLTSAFSNYAQYVSGTVNVPSGNFTMAQLNAVINQMGWNHTPYSAAFAPDIQVRLDNAMHHGSPWMQDIYEDAGHGRARNHHLMGDYYQLIRAKRLVEDMIMNSAVASYGNVRISSFNAPNNLAQPLGSMSDPFRIPNTPEGYMIVRVGR